MENGVTFIDTPGLSDPELRKEAASNITAALKEGGKFKILFMLTTLSGRVSPEDLTSIKIILDAVPTISENQFGIIVNRLGTAEYEGLRRIETFQAKLCGLREADMGWLEKNHSKNHLIEGG